MVRLQVEELLLWRGRLGPDGPAAREVPGTLTSPHVESEAIMAEQKEPQVMRLALTKPSQFSFNGSNGPVTGWKFTSLDGEEFNTFSKDLVEAWEKAGLVGKETDYKVAPNSNPKYPAKLVGIPGVFEGRQGGGGGWRGGSSGPMLTDRQAALFAALQNGAPLGQGG